MKTSYYANVKKIDKSQFEPVAISGDEGKLVGFAGRALRNLSPYPFFRKWKAKENEIENNFKNNLISKEDYIKFKQENQDDYINKFYNIVLKPLDPQEIYEELGENAVLLCFEKPTNFCHRFLVAGWLEMALNIHIDEFGFENDIEVKKNKENLKEKLKKYMENDKSESIQID